VALAEKEADIILWDGGNNDFSFIRPDLHIVLKHRTYKINGEPLTLYPNVA
jgi:predicted GTPase